MVFLRTHKILSMLIILVAVILTFAVIELLIIKYSGTPVAIPAIPREITKFGSEESAPLTYVVMGDSTAVGQGGDYEKGIALSTAHLLAERHLVTFQNVSISGARLRDVQRQQVPRAIALKPDVVLVSVGANDVTHLTSLHTVQVTINTIIDSLRTANPNVKIVLTGAPQMGSVPRFPEPVASIARARTNSVNSEFEKMAAEKHVTFGYIARDTGPIFDGHPELFAADKFHPTTAGYQVWIPVLNGALTTALQ
jgi:acyl-CoA thioesterase-1